MKYGTRLHIHRINTYKIMRGFLKGLSLSYMYYNIFSISQQNSIIRSICMRHVYILPSGSLFPQSGGQERTTARERDYTKTISLLSLFRVRLRKHARERERAQSVHMHAQICINVCGEVRAFCIVYTQPYAFKIQSYCYLIIISWKQTQREQSPHKQAPEI